MNQYLVRGFCAVAAGAALAASGLAGAGASGGTRAGTGQPATADRVAAALSAHRAVAVPGHTPAAAGTWKLGTWKLLPATPAITLTNPFSLVSVWTGHEMIIHGIFGVSPTRGRFTFAYRPATRTWTRLAAGPVWIALDTSDIAVWTGSRMLVIGQTSAAYDPAANRWAPVARPAGPASSVLGWTGRQLLMWFGTCCGQGSDGGTAYDPKTSTWRNLPASPLQTRFGAGGTWTGKKLIVAGGFTSGPPPQNANKPLRDGAAYNPVTRKWQKIAPMPLGRWGATAVWDGREVLFIGGRTGTANRLTVRGLAYNPATNHWRWLPLMEYPRDTFAAVWTGRQLLIWGGLTATNIPPPHGEAYTLATGQWTAMPASPLRGRENPTAVWTGRQLIVWGGSIPTKIYTDGAAYTPGTP